ncbi:MAG: iron-containing alcohol dehydrogenase, partial [Bacilli bacterium]
GNAWSFRACSTVRPPGSTVQANPTLEKVKEGIRLARDNNVELVLAIGGGSVLDSSKLIAHGFYYDGNPYDISLKKYVSTKALPVITMITIAAAGSEMSSSCVISDEENHLKRGFNSELNRPLASIENPELTYSVPLNQLGYGVVDIISHSLERYFNKSDDIEFADYIAEAIIKATIDSGIALISNPLSYSARATMMLASSYSHNGLTSLGKDAFMPIHQLEHELSGLYPSIAHGQGLAILIPAWMKVVSPLDKEKFIKFAKNVMMICVYENDEDLIQKGIEKLENIFQKFSMPSSLQEVGVKEEDLEIMADKLTNYGSKVFPSNIPLTKELSLNIYRVAFKEGK